MNKKGIALILSFMVIVVLAILSGAIVSRSVFESRYAQRYLESTQAFWLAEAGVNKALNSLRSSYASYCPATPGPLAPAGTYSYTWTASGGSRIVTATGFVPSQASPHVQRTLSVTMNKYIPPNFYGDAIYSAGNIVLKGSSYSVDGNVRYAGTISGSTSEINGTVTSDPSITPLALLDFTQLRTLSQNQGNYYDINHLNGPFPTTFWYNQTAGIPNIVFIEGSLTLKGNDKVGGFFVVGGQFTYDATISGNVSVDGCIYTRGNFTIKGGGNSLNVNGGVWSGQTSTLDGNAKITYNETYVTSIKDLNIDAGVQITSWIDTQNPYN